MSYIPPHCVFFHALTPILRFPTTSAHVGPAATRIIWGRFAIVQAVVSRDNFPSEKARHSNSKFSGNVESDIPIANL